MNQQAFIDDDDFDRVNQYKWLYVKNGAAARFQRHGKEKEIIYMHRFIMGASDKQKVIHLNHDRLDNRKANLKVSYILTHLTKGVFHDNDKWHVVIELRKHKRYIGSFPTKKEAEQIYQHYA